MRSYFLLLHIYPYPPRSSDCCLPGQLDCFTTCNRTVAECTNRLKKQTESNPNTVSIAIGVSGGALLLIIILIIGVLIWRKKKQTGYVS